jgi:putative glutamine amidotransferase
VCFGGTLWQDIPSQRPESREHRCLSRYERLYHEVEFVPGSALAAHYPGQPGAIVNSIHHQGIRQLAEGFRIEARCPGDGMIEAIRREGPGYVAGVQWHPEFHGPEHPDTLDDGPILREFLAACAARRGA